MDKAKTTADTDLGFAIVGGFYVYVTVPWLYVVPIISTPAGCGVLFNELLWFGGPNECKGDNYDNVEKTCRSDLTITDTMGDQGWPGMCLRVALDAHLPSVNAARPIPRGCQPRAALVSTSSVTVWAPLALAA